jgi:Protein of unknown function (DUF3048) N-terminal domain/Protein of unknown function (DUF3048) C-terminal domain
MKRLITFFILLALLGIACASLALPLAPTAMETPTSSSTSSPEPSATPTLTQTPILTQSPILTQTPTLAPTATAQVTPETPGPTSVPPDYNQLTGLTVADPALLSRRPLAIKVSNLPRGIRPQWGLSLADIIFEYYTEEGTTRFLALFYGNDASIVGPIRSARFLDLYLVRGYQAVFAYGFAYKAERVRLEGSPIANRLVIEEPGTPLYRYHGGDALVVSTADLSAYITKKGVGNGRQDLHGMTFGPAPSGGQPVNRVYVRYSSAIYNRWDYDPASGRYLRFADTVDDYTGGQVEQYKQSTDRLTKQPLASDNLVVLYVEHKLFSPGIYDINLTGSGKGVAFRDGQAYPVTWVRGESNVVFLTNPDGSQYAFKPGTTWFEVVGLKTSLTQKIQVRRFTHHMP